MNVGDRIVARVVDVLPGVILLEHEGMRGAVNIVELTWDEGERATTRDYVGAAGTLEVAVIAVDGERFSASVRQLRPELDPWREPPRIGERYRALVVSRRDWGASVLLVERGLVAVIVGQARGAPGETIDVEVTDCDPDRRRLNVREVR